jgi:ATP-dependent DNA ligase
MAAKPPGRYDEKAGAWVFPPREYVDVRGQARRFEVFARLRRADGAPLSEADWSGDPIDGVAEHWVVTGLVGHQPVTSEVTTVRQGKNLGKKNRTNCWTQAVREAEAKWKKAADRRAAVPDGARPARAVVPPMLLSGFNDSPPKTWPQYVQKKLDGVRAMVYPWTPEVAAATRLPPDDAARAAETGAVVLSRTQKVVPAWHLAAAARPFLAARPTAALDGELVAHGPGGALLPLQEISGMSRNPRTAGALRLEVFDVYDSALPDAPFSERTTWTRHPLLGSPLIGVVETVLVDSLGAAEDLHRAHLDSGHEGSVVRAPDGAYVPSFNGHRSKNTLKWKPRLSQEFQCVGFAAGEKGKAEGAIMWEIEIPPRDGHPKRRITIDPNMTLAERKALFSRLTANPRAFAKEFKDRPLTVEFFNWSEDGVPMQAKAVGFRDWDEVVP